MKIIILKISNLSSILPALSLYAIVIRTLLIVVMLLPVQSFALFLFKIF